MRIVILLVVLISALGVLVECCNHQRLKSAIYRWYQGKSTCPKCKIDRPINRIETVPTDFVGIWRVKVYVKDRCYGCRVLSEVSEWYVSDDEVTRVK